MSRFNNPKALSALIAARTQVASAASDLSAANNGFSEIQAAHLEGHAAPDTPRNVIQKLCFFTLCAYLLSSFANDFAFRFLHAKAYISTVTIVLIPILLMATGQVGRGLRAPAGKCLLALGIWLAICAPFSFWRGGSAAVLLDYYTKDYILYFVICACVITLQQLRTLILVQGIGAVLVILSCFAFGSFEDGRLAIAGTGFSFLSNSNELALQLLLGMIVFMFAFFRKSKSAKVVSICLLAIAARYMLKTGSRGILLASAAVIVIVFLMSRNKAMVLAVVLPLALVSLLLMPEESRHRLTVFSTGSSTRGISNIEEASALASQFQRTRMLRESLRLTFLHPLFGVGPGQFMAANSSAQEGKGELADWRGTHNSYTQISSEAGIPGFIFYMSILLLCLRSNYRLYKRIARRKDLEEYAGLAFCMLLSLVTYAIATFFFHLSYSFYLPILAGISTSLYLALEPVLARQSPAGMFSNTAR